ncbi:MAG TPA: lipocalin-like domain-containing protein [Blastocatellia bacterium]|nr:lipocalin-like domain-containing protein [Blastocatellia bacterium]
MDRIDRIDKTTKKNRRLSLVVILSVLFILSFGLVFADEWKQALPGYEFSFARDHASHPDYKIEWWYYTGNVVTPDDHRFGYQLTFFRVGVDREPVNPSRWAVRDLFMAHLAVTDISGQKFRFTEKINRAGIGWAGAATDSYRVWNEDWEARQNQQGQMTLRAMQDGIGLELTLDQGKPPVIHGARGISQKGAQAGNASHYYSLTRMPTRGAIVIDGQRYEVTGLSWMDHEFGTSFLEKEQQGWNWLSLQLDDQTELMLYEFRRADGQRDLHTSGTFVDSSGQAATIAASEFTLTPEAQWLSPKTGASYPVIWKVSVPSRRIELTVRAAVNDQELDTRESTRVNYWEGAVEVTGTKDGRPVQGRGYLEMTGYAGAAMSAILK